MRETVRVFDQVVAAHVLQWPEWLRPIMATGVFIGHPIVTIAIAAGVIGMGLFKHNTRLWVAGSVAAATLGFGYITKLLVGRIRPETEYVAGMHVESFSFPSGHSLGAMVSFGLLGYLLWQVLPPFWGYVAIIMAALLIVFVGVSRIYVGAHFPSDVLAGWLYGLIGLAVIIFIVRPII